MSKIQEALKRLQSNDSPGSPNEVPAHVPTPAPMNDDTASLKYVRPAVIIDIDEDALRAEGLIAPATYERELADQYRQIKRPLIASAFGKRAMKIAGGTIVMVTSANSGEGKTFSSINLALSMARERDHNVLLVDADVAKPHITKVLALEDHLGLLDLVDDNRLVPESLVLGTNIERLSILPAGRPRDNAAELLSSHRMDQVVRELAARFPNRVILFDSPPLLETAEAKVLLELAGQVVVIVRAEHTSQSAVHEALHLIKDDKAVNLVLNQSRGKPGQSNYAYGYGYNAKSAQEVQAQVPRSDKGSLWEASK